MSTTEIPLLPENWYHIYNRGINGQQLFFEQQNYDFFLKLLGLHVLGVAEIYAYCLLGNHFHLLVRILAKPQKRPHLGFSNLFNSYAQATNKKYNRTGSLFERPFRRKLIDSEIYRAQVLFYIHHNPVHHGLCDDFRHYPHSSYRGILSDLATHLKRLEVLEWFEGREGFVEFHHSKPDFEDIRNYVIE
ncbi:MAG: transposase [bacterium]